MASLFLCFGKLGFKLFYFLLEPSVVQKQVAESIALGAVISCFLKFVQDTFGRAEDRDVDPVNYLLSLLCHCACVCACAYILFGDCGTVRRRAWMALSRASWGLST